MTTNSNEIFSNPEKKPLEELFLIVEEDGVKIKVPALHKRWVSKQFFTIYLPLVMSGGKLKTNADLDEWIYVAEKFLEDMKFLLRLKHHEFWSTVIYQSSALDAVRSFLNKSTPFYVDVSSLPSDKRVLIVYSDILSAVVRIICRIITNKESDLEWISKDHLKSLIYSNFLISVPMLFDLITALGDSNLKILKKIFESLFRIEPNYKHDLTVAFQFLIASFDKIQQQAENEGVVIEDDGEEINEDLETPYDDLVLFTLDSVFTLGILLEVFPESRNICLDINLAQKLTFFYDNTIPYLYKNIYVINPNALSLKLLNETRMQILKAFRSIVYLHIETVMRDPENSLDPAEKFIGIMTECLSDRAFVIDYQIEYPIDLDVDILKQACKDLDNFKTDYVAKGYRDEADAEAFKTFANIENLHLDEPQPQPSSSKSSIPERPQPEGAVAAQIDYDVDKPSTSRGVKSIATTANETNKNPKARDIDLEVTSVLDVLPHLGDGFVRRVLSRYDNSEDAIAAILEQNLPPDLIHADQNEVYIPDDPQDKLYQSTGIKRYNIFDGDKYDIMTQDNPECIIKIDKGFPNAPQSLNEMLDDKKELAAVRHRYQEYTLVEEGNEYDDEYDDSYDALLESESRVAKTEQLKQALAEIDDPNDDNDDDDDESEEEEQQQQQQQQQTNNTSNSYKDNRMNFCENPEDVRARYEARRAAKFGHGSSKAPAPQPNRDVVGAAKGKGQTKEVLINRHKKDVNKSSRANHNRKAGAAFKRSKGMMG